MPAFQKLETNLEVYTCTYAVVLFAKVLQDDGIMTVWGSCSRSCQVLQLCNCFFAYCLEFAYRVGYQWDFWLLDWGPDCCDLHASHCH